ncbi:UDP-N-acetylmuramate dehydrogenase [Marivibrio halodurans]|uniref:UDP-N-acetylenolpyruvoylglucosamine reductase n=1 Tax=Marivibrio halodurans TaxID=2039722 RepID=A0A8J7V4I8_9PROT|nr:UDP-N-acetylmuramate dehydrogenase [Marivibrio halodurans]MBP5857734.1 UDP-N-acetylmuramate dehydrogenase [Marivibrio halodurans]
MGFGKPAPSPRLIDRLPPVRGRLTEGPELSRVTWFRVGGPAEVMFKPADLEDLQRFLMDLPADIPVMPLGVGSNLLVRDGGVRGVVLRLGGDFARIDMKEAADGKEIVAGAAALDANVAKTAANHALTGLEFFAGIPGTIGGALRMNAGAYGTETKDVLIEATALDRTGTLHRVGPEEMGMHYRHTDAPADWIFVEGRFRAVDGERADIFRRIEEIQRSRAETQPIRTRTGGSTFKNPAGGKAWQAIDAAGCRGLTVGSAQVSEQHCNFLINTGGARAADLETLGEEVRRRVRETSGTELEWEIKRVGESQER